MGWDLTLTPYDDREHRLLVSLSRSKGAARVLRERLHLRVRISDRDPDVVALLNEAGELRPWLQVAFAETVTRGPGVFLGRDTTLDDYGGAAARRYGDLGAALGARLAELGELDPLLTSLPIDTVGRVFLASPARVEAIAERISELDPSLQPLSPEDADALMREGPRDLTAIRGHAFCDWALAALLGLLLWTAREELGLAICFDGLPRLKATDAYHGSARELELVAPERLEVLSVHEASVREHTPRAGCLPLVAVVLTVLLLSVLLASAIIHRIRAREHHERGAHPPVVAADGLVGRGWARVQDGEVSARHEPGSGRAEILAAAMKEFADRGYTGATTAGIARRAGVTQPLVHHHFGSKQGLWNAVLEELFGDLQSMLEKALPEVEGADRKTRIAHLLRAFVRFSGGRPELSRLIRTESSAGGQPYKQMYETWLRGPTSFLQNEMAAAMEDGTFRKVDQGLAYFIVVGASTQAFAEPEMVRSTCGADITSAETIERYAELVVDILMRGMLAD